MSIQSNIFNLVKVSDGLDSNNLRIITSTESVLKFPMEVNNDNELLYEFSPGNLKISLKEFENNILATDYTIQILLNNVNLKDIVKVAKLEEILYKASNSQNEYRYIFNINKLYEVRKDSEYINNNYSSDVNYYFNILINFFTGAPSNIEIQTVYNGNIAYKYLLFQLGTKEEAARLDIAASGIFASIADAGLEFSSTGLIIKNGNFKIENSSNEKVLSFDSNAQQLIVRGNIYANDGVFNGEVHASSGSFSGAINATSGTIGGFEITNNTIQTTGLTLTAVHDNIEYIKAENLDETTFNENKTDYWYDSYYYQEAEDLGEITFNENKTNYWYLSDNEYIQCTNESEYDNQIDYYIRIINKIQCTEDSTYDQNIDYYTQEEIRIPSSIDVDNINIGIGAVIKDYLQIGNLKLLNPNNNDNKVLSLELNGQNYFTLTNEGEIIGANWSIQEINGNITATFDRLVAQNGEFSGTIYATNGHFEGEIVSSIINASTINTANFITEKIRSMGGAFIFKPTFEIISYQYINVNENDLYKFKFIIDSSYMEYFINLDFTKINVISVSGLDVRYGKIESINENNDIFEVYIWFYKQDYNVLVNENNNYNTLTLLGEIGSNTLNTIIGINSDNVDTILTPRALSMMQISSFEKNGSNSGYLTYESNLLLGDLSNVVIEGRALSGYGLYADNVYLKGSLTTNTSSNYTYAGVNTYQNVNFNYTVWNQAVDTNNDDEKVVFWGGANGFDVESINKAPFIVTNKGNIYARSGEFKGAVIADSLIANSVIQAAIIEGIGNSPSLKIYDTNNDLGGIGFYKKVNNIDNNENNENNDILTLNINNSGFYHNDINFISWNNNDIFASLKQITIENTIFSNGQISYGNTNGTSITFGESEIQLNYQTSGILQISDNLTTMYGKMSLNNNNNQKLNYKVNNGYYCLFVN